MPLDLQRITRKAISETVADQLRVKILLGEVAPGERLPSERELAVAFGTNRNTLREAIRRLEAQGLVTVRQGDGVRVTDFRTQGALSLLPELLRLSEGDERRRLVQDALMMRRRMAVEVAGLAAERCTDATVGRMRALVQEQRRHQGDLLQTMRTDLELYGAMVEAADSVIASLLFSTLTRLVQACLELTPALLFVHRDYVAAMTSVVDAIESRDVAGAREALGSLLNRTDAVLLARLEEGS
jgi:DNA-binding FadR family transcriptional regulator